MRTQFLLPSKNNTLVIRNKMVLPNVKRAKTGLQTTLKQASSFMGNGLIEKLQKLQITKMNRGGKPNRIIGMLR